MENKEKPEKRRKLEGDKGDGVLPVPTRSPRVVLNKIKLKEDVLERLRKIKRLAQAKVKEDSLSTSDVPEKDVKESQTEQVKSTDIGNKALRDDAWKERKQKRKREEEDDDKEEQKSNVAKVAKVNSETVAKETQSICESVEKKDADPVAPEEDTCDKSSASYDKEKDDLVSSVEEYMSNVSNREDPFFPIATQSKGDDVTKAAQNYAKSGAQTEPKLNRILTDEKLVVVVNEVLEEGNNRNEEDSHSIEQETSVDNNNRGEQEEAISDERRTDDEDGMTDAIYQLIKDVVKNRTEYFESALLRENEKLEERVSQLEKQNALLQRVGYRLDYALKEITRKRQEARQSLISRGTQVNMNLHLSRTSTSKSTAIEIDVSEREKDRTSSPKNNSRSLTSTSRQSPINSETIVIKSLKEQTALSSSPSKLEENRSIKTKSVESKPSSGCDVISVPQKDELVKKISTTQQHQPQDASFHKKLQPGMGHFRLSPSYKRAAQQQGSKDDTIETGHYRITPSGLEQQTRILTQRVGNSLVNEHARAQPTTKPSPSTPRAQNMDTSLSQSPPSQKQSNSNSTPLAVSSSTLAKSQQRPSSFSQTTAQEERSISIPASLKAVKNARVDNVDRRPHTPSTVTVPARSSPLSKTMSQEKRNLPAPPSLINTKTTRVEDLRRNFPSSSTSNVPTVSKSSPSSSGQHRTFTNEPSGQRSTSVEKMESSQQRKESGSNEEPDIMIVSPATVSSPKQHPKKGLGNEKAGSQMEIPASRVQNNNEKPAQVRIHHVVNQSLSHEGRQPSNRQTNEVMRTPQQNIQQIPQRVNHPSSSNQQVVYRSHDTARVSTASRNNIPPLRSNEPQQHVRYIVREDGTRLQIPEQPRQVQADKVQHDPRQLPRYVVQDAQGQCQVVEEQNFCPTDKAPTAVRYDPKQSPRYVIQEGPSQQMHNRSPRPVNHEVQMHPRQPVPYQQVLPPGSIVVQQHKGNVVTTAGNKVMGPPIGIQDVRTQLPQPYPTQQQPQQHIIVKQHPPVQNPQQPQQFQRTTYQYQQQQPQHRPSLPQQQQNVPRTRTPGYYPPQTLQQVPPRATLPTGYQPRPTVPPREYVTSSRLPPERPQVKSNVPVGGPVHPIQQVPDVVYQPGALEGTNVRAAAPMPPRGYDRYQPRPMYVQPGRQPQLNNQGPPRAVAEQSMPRPPSQGGVRYAQTLEQQRIQERRAQVEASQDKSQTSPTVARRDSGPCQPPSPPSPPKPTASIAIVENGIVLSWNITTGESTDSIECYELFACQDDSNSTLPPILWKKIGVVKALPLPMACTLTQFSSGSRYQFAVRAVDNSERAGPFSDPCVITLKR